MSASPRLTVATSFPIHPPLGGGQRRVFGLYGGVAAQGIAVDVVALTDPDDRPVTREIAPGLREIRVPKSDAHEAAEIALGIRAGIPVTDIALAVHHDLTPAYAEALAASARDAAAVVACHPFAQPALAAACPDRPLIYEAQDVETDLKAEMLAGRADDVLEIVRAVEAACCARADLVMTCSEEDADRLHDLLGAERERTIVVPNGCDCGEIRFTGLDERADAKRALGIDSFVALFTGSWHEPNLVAARAILAAAREAPEVRFLLVGSAGLALVGDDVPSNVDITGPVPEGFLRAVLRVADVALNPMSSGSGTNLKMLEYAAAGVPMIASRIGARGMGFAPGRDYVLAEPDELARALAAGRAEPRDVVAKRARLAYDRVLSTFDWPVIARALVSDEAFEKVLATRCR